MTYNYNDIDLNNPADLRRLILTLTDGVYNTSDTASFNDPDIAIIDKVRAYGN